MSDETQSTVPEEVPPAPLPEAPAPAVQTGNGEPPQEPAAAPAGEGAQEETGEDSPDATDSEEVPEEGSDGPVVQTTPTGQRVTFPDGRVVHTRSSDAPVSNTEWRQYERTHQGDQLRYQFKPGDREYTPYSDPNVPNSNLAQQIEREIASFAERVLKNPEAEVSYIWNALHGLHEGELDRAIATGGGSDKVMA